MAKRRTTRPKGPKNISEQEDPATSPLILDNESDPALVVDPTVKPRPKPRPTAKKPIAIPEPEVVDDLEIPQQRPKRGRPRSNTNATVPESIVQPPVKKAKTSGTTLPVQHDGNLGDSRSKALQPRSLPSRTKRVVNPGGPDKKRPKRTSAEVAADAKQKKNLQTKLEKLERDKIRMLAEMEAVEEKEQQEDERMVIKDIADLVEFREGDTQYGKEGMVRDNDSDVVMADGDDYEKEADNGFVEVDSEPESEGRELETVKMKKKAASKSRGAIRAAVDKEKVVSRQNTSAKTGDNLKQDVHTRTQAGTSKTKSTTKFPTGLVADWKSKISKNPHNNDNTQNHQRASSPLGGLADDDAHGERPKNLNIGNRYKTQAPKNELKILVYDSDPDFIEYEKPKPEVREVLVWDSDPDFIEYRYRPATPERPSEKKAPKKPKKPSTMAKSSTNDTIKSEAAALGSLVSTVSSNSENGSVLGLPSFVRANWAGRFLPTLYNRFGSSKEPWKMFTKGEEMVLIVQEVINAVYPNNTYSARWGDSICITVNNRLYSKRSLFGSRAIQVVEQFFRTEEFVNKPTRVAQYAKWAVKDNGPALWRVPTPETCKHGPESDQYIRPVDIFESDYIIQVFMPFVKGCKDSCVDYGYLVGALALSAAGVERAFKMFLTGEKVNIGQFSRDNTEILVDDYVENTAKLSERRWKRIMDRCGGAAENEPAMVNISCMDERRRVLYVPSSPAASDDEK